MKMKMKIKMLAYVIIYDHYLGKTSYRIINFVNNTCELDVRQLYSNQDYQNGTFYKYTQNYNQVIQLTHNNTLIKITRC